MTKPNVLVLRAPGTNCDEESAFAFELAGAATESIHINRILEKPDLFKQFQILCLPGGFSYGDDIAAGRILGNQIGRHLIEALQSFKDDGKLILGICNGFQVLIRSGILLPDDATDGPLATLSWNDSGKYEDRWVQLEVSSKKSVFLKGIESMYLPVAHAEGKFVARTDSILDALSSSGQLTLRYQKVAGQSNGQVPYPQNPNGSARNVAGICDTTGRVFGLMPHPERNIVTTHHPRWTRGDAKPEGDGLQIFRNAVEYFN